MSQNDKSSDILMPWPPGSSRPAWQKLAHSKSHHRHDKGCQLDMKLHQGTQWPRLSVPEGPPEVKL